MKSLEAKVVVLGSQGVGKTSIVVRYASKTFTQHISPTIGASFFTCKATIDDYRVKLQVWDTAGQERFRSMAPMYYRNANAAMLIYDITSSDSFEMVKSWATELISQVQSKLVLCVLGNKSDLASKTRQVKQESGRAYAESIGASFYETSAMSNEGIDEAFFQVAKKLIILSEDIPDSGIHVTESVSFRNWEIDSITSREEVESNFHGNLVISGSKSMVIEDRKPCFTC